MFRVDKFSKTMKLALLIRNADCFSKYVVPHVGMSIKERLKAAYENVAFNADKTWIHHSYTFQRANQELFSKEYQLQLTKTVELRPRTVKDCIPKSKLAQYSNYEYNEARELSYAPSNSNFNSFIYYSREPENQSSKEPWLLPEVDDLFIWFTNHHHFANQISYNSLEKTKNSAPIIHRYEPINYESPILKVDTFDKRILKMQITSDRIKNIWNLNNINVFTDCTPVTKDKILNAYKTPASIFYLSPQDDENKEFLNEEFLKKLKLNDFEHLKYLSKSFKEQNSWVLKCMTRNIQPTQTIIYNSNTNIDYCETKNDCAPARRLYSAVLQGLTNSQKSSPNKTEHFIPLMRIQKEEVCEKVESLITATATNCNATTLVQSSNNETQNQMKNDIPGLCILNPSVKNFVQKTEQAKTQQNVAKQNNTVKATSRSPTPEIPTTSAHTMSTASSQIHYNPPNYVQPTMAYSSLNNSFPNSFPVTPTPYLNNYNYQFNSHFSNSYQNNCIYTNTFTTNMSQIVVSRGLQSLPSQNYLPRTYQISPPLIMVQQNRTSTMYPMSQQQYVQQSYYCPNISAPRPVQRWLQSDYTRSTLPQQSFPTSVPPQFIPQPPAHWIGQNNQVIHNNSQYSEVQANRIRGRTKRILQPVPNIPQAKTRSKILVTGKTSDPSEEFSKTNKKSSSSSGVETIPPQSDVLAIANNKTYGTHLDDFDEVVNKTVNILLDDNSRDIHVPVTPSLSEELEIQALEQYCNSSDNVYQELERQAEEQYEDYSVNWKSPPNDRLFFGGLGLQWNYV